MSPSLNSWIRYFGAALVFKAFSRTTVLKNLYRRIGNRFGQRRHSAISKIDIRRGLWLCNVFCNNKVPDIKNTGQHQATILELGTGWTHFYSIFLRLFYDLDIIAFDIWDNRQFLALGKRFAKLANLLPNLIPKNQAHYLNRIQQLTEGLSQCKTFDEVYNLLGITYVVEPSGNLDFLADESVDMVFSVDVLEHIEKGALNRTIRSMRRVLKPGGISAHQIGLDDHLQHYAHGMASKQYLKFSDSVWKILFENKIQYFNRIQLPDFQVLFKSNGFHLIECTTEKDSALFDHIKVQPQFQHFDVDTLLTTRAFIVHRKIQ